MSRHLTAIVIPCLNEEKTLSETCGSLGFGLEQEVPADTVLILVDNASTDATNDVAKRIQERSPAGSVVVTVEGERGYVPPRRHGNATAMNLADERGLGIDSLLILQADADTFYSAEYSDSMTNVARNAGHGVVIDARTEYPYDFATDYGEFIVLSDEIDAEFETTFPEQSEDVIVDDKACGYWAPDYQLWGGHLREFTSGGDEIHSETTRLYIRAKAHGASRVFCETAVAQHSGRRIIAEPAYNFATAGFPREQSFKTRWNESYAGPGEIVEFCKAANRSKIELALKCRRAHMYGLFLILTTHVGVALGQVRESDREGQSNWDELPRRDMQVARDSPGQLIEDVLQKIDQAVFEYSL
jgi:glycosyltransferase involved in cell wall biosynthesis